MSVHQATHLVEEQLGRDRLTCRIAADMKPMPRAGQRPIADTDDFRDRLIASHADGSAGMEPDEARLVMNNQALFHFWTNTIV